MTPSEIETAARRKYNSTGSSFFATAEIYDLIYQAELEIARETRMLEGLTTTVSVQGTRAYAYPTGVLEIKRIEYNGAKLKYTDFRDDDNLTLLNSDVTTQGIPIYYSTWNDNIYLRAIPNASADTIRIYYYKLPLPVTTASQVLEVPTLWHMSIVDYVVAEMATKDLQHQFAQVYFDKWNNKHLPAMKSWVRRRKVDDAFKTVKTEEHMIGTYLGGI